MQSYLRAKNFSDLGFKSMTLGIYLFRIDMVQFLFSTYMSLPVEHFGYTRICRQGNSSHNMLSCAGKVKF